jgi:hypothetical protein
MSMALPDWRLTLEIGDKHVRIDSVACVSFTPPRFNISTCHLQNEFEQWKYDFEGSPRILSSIPTTSNNFRLAVQAQASTVFLGVK